MNNKTHWLLGMAIGAVLLVIGTAICPCGIAASPKKRASKVASQTLQLAGDWNGALNAGGQQLRLVFHLAEKSGKITGTLDSLDQNARGIPVEAVTMKQGVFTIPVKMVNGRFEGKQSTASVLKGTWFQNQAKLPLTLTRSTP